MKKWYTLFAVIVLHANTSFAQDSTALKIKAIESSFNYQHGSIKIGNGIGVIDIPTGFKYLDSVQAEKVLTKMWNNPKTDNMTLGFILPEKQGMLDEHGYVFNIQYDAIGYVKDNDADDINYDDLLEKIKSETKENNKEREKDGYAPIEIVGWASKPYYDKSRRILHWAKEIKFGTDSINTLNYNVRVLGRRGVIVLNAIATMDNLAIVKADIPQVLNIVHFTEGNKYSDFIPKIDQVAAWTIGGLVAGKILAKVGFFVLALKFWKLIVVGFAAVGSGIRKFFKRKKATSSPEEEKEPMAQLNAPTGEEEEKLEETKKEGE
ncbi:MAG TPA: DUF2167 domain-containing protein [Mucilaginibacter sp.]|jgi:uncharacterized membrane-anchored protein